MSDKIKFTYKDDRLTIEDGDLVKAFEISDAEDPILKYVLKAIDQLDNEPEHKIVTVTLKPSFGYSDDSLNKYISSGEFIPLVEGDVYNVTFKGVVYENVPVRRTTETLVTGDTVDFLYLGNFGSSMLRSPSGQAIIITPELVEEEYPFCITVLTYNGRTVYSIWASYSGNFREYIDITLANDNTKTYSLYLYEVPVGSYFNFPGTFQENAERFGASIGRSVDIIVNGDKETVKWQGEDTSVSARYYQAETTEITYTRVELTEYEKYEGSQLILADKSTYVTSEFFDGPFEVTIDTLIS